VRLRFACWHLQAVRSLQLLHPMWQLITW
jgi:hypothetical protein